MSITIINGNEAADLARLVDIALRTGLLHQEALTQALDFSARLHAAAEIHNQAVAR